MREGIGLYKAKRKDNGKWINGYLFCIWEKAYILWGTTNGIPNMVEVDPDTVCEWTGLFDKNGVRIFEMDMVTIENTKKQGMPACVQWEQENCQFVASRIGYQPINLGCFEDKTQWVVIGNIHDKAVEE